MVSLSRFPVVVCVCMLDAWMSSFPFKGGGPLCWGWKRQAAACPRPTSARWSLGLAAPGYPATCVPLFQALYWSIRSEKLEWAV